MLPLPDLALVRAVEATRYRPAMVRARRRRRRIRWIGARLRRTGLYPCPTC